MKTYQTAQVAEIIGIHPNTVRMYEEWGLVPKAERRENGYRVFTEFHVAQFRLVRLALQIEVLQNGMRKKIMKAVKLSAQKDFDRAAVLVREYLRQGLQERRNAEEAAEIVRSLMSGGRQESSRKLRRKEVSECLQITMDALRNWEMNGLLTVKRRENGYRVYTDEDIRRLKIIRSLRCANYSLEAILRLLRELSDNPGADIQTALNTPEAEADIISVCDKLMVSLQEAEKNARKLLKMLGDMKIKFE